MRAAFCAEAGRMVVREVPSPEVGAGEALVRVVGCGVCGSDLHWYGGGMAPPRVCPGHEIVGEVVAVNGESGVREGDRVAVEPLRSCGTCARCGAGNYHLCAALRILGIHDDGGLADRVRVPCSALFRIPPEVGFSVAVLAEPLAVSVHAARLGAIGEGDRVLVLGSGAIGLLSVVAARHRGASEIVATARYGHQAAAAKSLGATRVFATDAEAQGELRDWASENEIDVVLETVGGAAPTLREAVQLVAPGGRVVVLGLFDEGTAFSAMVMLYKEVRVIGSMVYNRVDGVSDFERSLEILRTDSGRLESLVTHRYSLDDCDRAFATAADKGTGALKVVVEP